MKIKYFALATLLFAHIAQANNPSDLAPISLTHKNQQRLVGYINGKGDLVIPPRFDSAQKNADGELVAAKNEKWGMINTKGEWLIKPQFDYLGDFVKGLAYAKKGEQTGFINKKGEWVVLSPSDKFDYLDMNISESGLIKVEKNEKVGFIDTNGELVIPTQFEDANPFSKNGLAAAKKNDKWGFIDTKGVWVIEPTFSEVGTFGYNGLVVAEQKGKAGYINAKGDWVIPPKFDVIHEEGMISMAEDFGKSGLARIVHHLECGFINSKGEWVFPPKFDCEIVVANFNEEGISPLHNILRQGNDTDIKMGYIDENGWIIEPKFTYISDFSKNGLAVAVISEKEFGYINAKGEWVLPPKFDNASPFFDNGLAEVEKDGVRAYINQQGETVVTIKKVCDVDVLARPNGERLYPKESDEALCGN